MLGCCLRRFIPVDRRMCLGTSYGSAYGLFDTLIDHIPAEAGIDGTRFGQDDPIGIVSPFLDLRSTVRREVRYVDRSQYPIPRGGDGRVGGRPRLVECFMGSIVGRSSWGMACQAFGI